jgi:hypothetical protein
MELKSLYVPGNIQAVVVLFTLSQSHCQHGTGLNYHNCTMIGTLVYNKSAHSSLGSW